MQHHSFFRNIRPLSLTDYLTQADWLWLTTHRLTDWMIEYLTDKGWLTGWLPQRDWLTDWLVGWLPDWKDRLAELLVGNFKEMNLQISFFTLCRSYYGFIFWLQFYPLQPFIGFPHFGQVNTKYANLCLKVCFITQFLTILFIFLQVLWCCLVSYIAQITQDLVVL